MKGLILVAVLLTGCVSYSHHELPPVQVWPPTADAPVQKPTVYVRTTVMSQVNGGPAKPAMGAAATVAQGVVVDGFRESGRFAQVSTDKGESDIYAEATLYNDEQFSMASAIITGATFFVIPTTAKNTYTLETVFKDDAGKELGRIRKSESVRTWMQLLLIVAVPFRQDIQEVVQALTRSTLEEGVQRGLL
ncbi:hypothetical protein DYL61_21350 [Pseudomonas nabeulensis]|uniref:Uncharacterized protein n=1 Tax=Pseudomonas nabeulensis TaxID=2293833 RepID=A0A4Z0AUC3_9PSED|nr:hypothetical protein [Pseudomonas nabeulensis]TFY89957.1 hypothetical protein DYL61_21350 [Pseudomonas nabeulensis]